MTPDSEHLEPEEGHGFHLNFMQRQVSDTRDGWKAQATYLADEYNKLADRWKEANDRAEAAETELAELRQTAETWRTLGNRCDAAETRLEAVREWAERSHHLQREGQGDAAVIRSTMTQLLSLLDPADGGAEQFNENPDEFHPRPDPETYRGGGVMGRKRPADGEEG